MPFIWNDPTYWDRFKKSWRIEVRVFWPLVFVSMLLWYLFLKDSIQLIHLILLSVASAAVIFTFFNMFLQLPNEKIPDYYPKWARTLMYIFQFLIVCFSLYILLTKIIFVA